MFTQDLETDDILSTFIFPWLVDEVLANKKWIGQGRSLLHNRYSSVIAQKRFINFVYMLGSSADSFTHLSSLG